MDFKIAWAVEGYTPERPGKDNPEYVEWLVQITEEIDGVKISQPLAYHKCSPQEFEAFHKPSPSFMNKVDQIRARQNLFCIDAGQKIKIYGEGDTTDYKRLDIMLVPPTNPKHTLEETIDYLGPVDFVIYHNTNRFFAHELSQEFLKKESIVVNSQFDQRTPNFIHAEL